jgi:hypothetical protein
VNSRRENIVVTDPSAGLRFDVGDTRDTGALARNPFPRPNHIGGCRSPRTHRKGQLSLLKRIVKTKAAAGAPLTRRTPPRGSRRVPLIHPF